MDRQKIRYSENVLHQAEAILAGNNLPLSLKKRFVHRRKNSNLVVKRIS